MGCGVRVGIPLYVVVGALGRGVVTPSRVPIEKKVEVPTQTVQSLSTTSVFSTA